MKPALIVTLLCLIVPMCAARAQSAALPPVPKTAPTALGPIPIHRVANLTCKGVPAWGCFHPETWVIEIDSAAGPFRAWATVRHEIFHATMYVEGITFTDSTAEDRLAESVAKQATLEMRAGWPR